MKVYEPKQKVTKNIFENFCCYNGNGET